METPFIVYNTMRYGESKKLPNNVTCYGTLEQAKFLAEWMSRYYPGQEGMWLVKGYEDE